MSRYDENDEPREDLSAWLAAGIRRADALTWRRWNFTLVDARRWRAAGVREALGAAQWQAAGVGPEQVAEWTSATISATEAVRWREFGFDIHQAREHLRNGRGPEEAFGLHAPMRRIPASGTVRYGPARGERARSFAEAGVPPEVMRSYLFLQWTDDEAVAWARQGIQAWDAKIWQSIGITPAEADELQEADVDPHHVVQEWWRAGIPFEEVADWLGAGLSPAEAVEQRAAGVTVEQAAALRALRRGGGI